jgi:hypothetical protein
MHLGQFSYVNFIYHSFFRGSGEGELQVHS